LSDRGTGDGDEAVACRSQSESVHLAGAAAGHVAGAGVTAGHVAAAEGGSGSRKPEVVKLQRKTKRGRKKF